MNNGELFETMDYNDLLDLKASSLQHLIDQEITLEEYLLNEDLINQELVKHKGEK